MVLPQHPAARLARQYIIVSICAALLAAGTFAGGVPALGAASAIAAAFFLWSGVVTSRAARSALLVNVAYERLTRGQVEEAEALLAQIETRTAKKGSVARSIAMQRAMIALYHGDAERAAQEATRGLEAPRAMFGADYQAMQDAGIVSVRALSHAALGRGDEARADAARAESAEMTTPVAVARAALARAVVVSRTEGAPGLAALFAPAAAGSSGAHGGAARMIEHLPPRERVLARALRRMARAPRPHAYREAARKEDEPQEAKEMAGWVAKLVPAAAAYANDSGKTHAPNADLDARPAATAEARETVARLRTAAVRSAPSRWRVLLLWVLLVVVFLAIWQLLTPASDAPRVSPPVEAAPWYVSWWAVGLLMSLIVVSLTGWQLWKQRQTTRALATARLDLARGEEARAERALREMSGSKYDAVAGNAWRLLAELAERRGDFTGCLAACSAGFTRLWRNSGVRALQSDIALPEIVATLAFALAVVGQRAESDAERARLAEDYPSYPLAARAHFRIALAAALRAGDVDAAAKVARARTADLPLALREDLLVDVVLAVADGATPEELDRIVAELRDDDESRAWVDAVAPGLRDRMHLRARVEPAPLAEADDDDDDDAPVSQRRGRRALC